MEELKNNRNSDVDGGLLVALGIEPTAGIVREGSKGGEVVAGSSGEVIVPSRSNGKSPDSSGAFAF